MERSTKQGKRARVVLLAVLMAYVLVAGTATFLPVHGEEQIYDAVIRLHVVANSDTEQDQALKLQVRDAVLELAGERLVGCGDREEAARRLNGMIEELEAVAEQTLLRNGCDLPVCVVLGEEEYPTRDYESFCFPAGEYLSLRVLIGEADGQNFWCVLFPPLCMSAATVGRDTAKEEFIAVGLSRDQYSIITETENTQYRVRFKFLEVLEPLFRNNDS